MVDAVASSTLVQQQSADASAQLTDNFDTFLSLLTAQLENQDPLEPVDSTEFTNQLVAFSGVEQQIQTNEAMADLISITANSTAASLSGYLGKDIVLDSPVAEFSGDDLKWNYDVPAEARVMTISVLNEDGAVVYAETGNTSEGKHSFTWNGETTNGGTAPDGAYTMVINAEDVAGEVMTPAITLNAIVSGVDLSTGETAIQTTGGLFNFSQVLSFADRA